MNPTPKTMQAVALNKFGGPEALTIQTIPVPEIDADEVLIRIETAGVGEWDPFEREGGYAEMSDVKPKFPYVLGSEGAGTIAAVGSQVSDFKEGDQVYAPGFLNFKGGFYAEYVAIKANLVSPVPSYLSVAEAGVMSGVGLTALRGLEDILKLKSNESILIFGASGGIGHLAVQLAKKMGARVFAVASGADGVTLVKTLGADEVIDGHEDNVLDSIRAFAPDGLDAALLTAGGEAAEKALEGLKAGGRVAYPNGIDPEPKPRKGLELTGYNGEPDPDILKRFNRLIESGPLTVSIAHTYPLEEAAEAHKALDEHYLGKLALHVSDV